MRVFRGGLGSGDLAFGGVLLWDGFVRTEVGWQPIIICLAG